MRCQGPKRRRSGSVMQIRDTFPSLLHPCSINRCLPDLAFGSVSRDRGGHGTSTVCASSCLASMRRPHNATWCSAQVRSPGLSIIKHWRWGARTSPLTWVPAGSIVCALKRLSSSWPRVPREPIGPNLATRAKSHPPPFPTRKASAASLECVPSSSSL